MSSTKKDKTEQAPKKAAAKSAVAPDAKKVQAIKKPAEKIESTPVSKPVAKPVVKKIELVPEKVVEAPKADAPKKVAKSASPRVQVLGHGVGRRKTAIARVWLRRGKGALKVNGKDSDLYFDTDVNRREARFTLQVMPVAMNYDIDVNVVGGGMCAQAGAIKLGIARALVAIDDTIRAELKKFHLLSVDPRRKERKKYGQKAARRKFQFVKR
jgi:small subunit ribosomal protein S9